MKMGFIICVFLPGLFLICDVSSPELCDPWEVTSTTINTEHYTQLAVRKLLELQQCYEHNTKDQCCGAPYTVYHIPAFQRPAESIASILWRGNQHQNILTQRNGSSCLRSSQAPDTSTSPELHNRVSPPHNGLHVLGTSSPLTVELGGSLMLPCYVKSPIPLEKLEVAWKRTDPESLVHLFQDGESRPESQSQAYRGRASFFTEEIKHGNFSLLLTDLTNKDAGVYKCYVYRQHETGQTSVEIKEIKERLIVAGGRAISAYVGEDITLNCSVDSHIPPKKLEVSWKKVDQQIPVLIFQEGEVQAESTHERYMDRVEFFSPAEIHRGNFSLRIKDLRTEDKGLYICEVFSGEFSANTTVEVRQLGFSSVHIGILFLCVLACAFPIFLSYHAYTALKRNDNSRAALSVQYVLVISPSIALFFAFILWGVIEGFFTEAATCSTLNLLRIVFLFWVAPYLSSFQDNIRRFIERSAVALEYAVITTLAYSVFVLRFWKLYQENQKIVIPLYIVLLVMLLLLLYINIFIQGIKKHTKVEGWWNYRLTEFINSGRGFIIMFLYVFDIGYALLASLPFLPVLISICRCQCFLKKESNSESRLRKENALVLLWMSVLLILEVLIALLSVYIVNDILKLKDNKECVGLTCVAAYLYILTVILLFEFLSNIYARLYSGSDSSRNGTWFSWRSGSRVPETPGHAKVYMLGAVGLIFVNSVALVVELALKAQNGERTVKDLRAIVMPSECVFALCCLSLQISTFWRTYRKKLRDVLKDLRWLCKCEQASTDLPVLNHELQALQSREPTSAPQDIAYLSGMKELSHTTT